MKDFDKVNKGKEIHEMECLFSIEEIEQTLWEMYPNMERLEVYYHAQHLEDYDSLKVAKGIEDLKEAIREQLRKEEEYWEKR